MELLKSIRIISRFEKTEKLRAFTFVKDRVYHVTTALIKNQ